VRIEAHKVYNEYIQDKHHVHMNSTKWITLSEYVKHLGREGYCTVEETPKGWFIRLIHRDLHKVCLSSAPPPSSGSAGQALLRSSYMALVTCTSRL
jgi:hypothetical protein